MRTLWATICYFHIRWGPSWTRLTLCKVLNSTKHRCSGEVCCVEIEDGQKEDPESDDFYVQRSWCKDKRNIHFNQFLWNTAGRFPYEQKQRLSSTRLRVLRKSLFFQNSGLETSWKPRFLHALSAADIRI
ncbi:hypothetical protein AV530_020185 [Patagioenas fasciata monilis]|uniref:Uncharacterized protein n=1 Tax=Patagioenas fasciata monilis TaxID=372326 RepID=A0A1V4KZ94_PATFA|nr:hypothetical protein AV530_020185 [Patagioenas fasciata monilis]